MRVQAAKDWAVRLAAPGSRAHAKGADWSATWLDVAPGPPEVSTPFVALAGDELVAHVGVIAIPLVLEGTRTTNADIYAVGTHPAHRGRGHIRRLLEEALAFWDERFETAQLTTAVPEVFRPHGFRLVPQHRFVVAVPAAREGAGMTRLRRTSATDVALAVAPHADARRYRRAWAW